MKASRRRLVMLSALALTLAFAVGSLFAVAEDAARHTNTSRTATVETIQTSAVSAS